MLRSRRILENNSRLRFVGLFIVCLIATISPSLADSADEMLPSCETLIRQIQESGDQVLVSNKGRPCWDYFSAVQDLITIADADGRAPLLGICAPPSSRLTQIIRIFVEYAQRNPAQLHESAGLVAFMALRAAFPCH